MSTPRLVRRIFTAVGTTTFTPPAGVKHIFAQGIGGGGGGGKGDPGGTTVGSKASGGAGGGAPTESVVPLTVTPGTSYDIIVGVAGTGSTTYVTVHGGSGGDSRIQPTGGSVATELVCWPGACGGLSADGTLVGGFPVGGTAVRGGGATSLTTLAAHVGGYAPHLGAGGYGTYSGTATVARKGSHSATALGGDAGFTGVDNTYRGGGGGGGGAAGTGAGGVGSDGANGRNSSGGFTASAGGVGAGYGSGGGGGGGGGSAPLFPGAGGNGGDGTAGRIILFWWE